MKKQSIHILLALVATLIFNNTSGQQVSYLWSTGDTTAIINPSPTVSTTYYVTITQYNVSYVDSFNLVVSLPASSFVAQTICRGDTITTANGNFATIAGIYQDTISSTAGCDSIVTLQLSVDTLDLSITTINDSLVSNEANAIAYQWLNCDSNNAVIIGANNRSYEPTLSGNYAVIVTKGACSDTSSCSNIVISKLIERTNKPNFSIYPNPTAGTVYLELTRNPETESTLSIYNLTGQLVKEFQIQNKRTLININELKRTVYFFHYENRTKKIVLTN